MIPSISPRAPYDFNTLSWSFVFLDYKQVSKAAAVSRIFKRVADEFYNLRIFNTCSIYQTPLSFSSGSLIYYKNFSKDPLFIGATELEKKRVFFHLLRVQSAKNKYDQFLINLELDNWFEIYGKNPFESSIFAIKAFFDKKIDLEELFVIHAVCEAFHILKIQPLEKNKVKVTKVEPKIISANEIADYLSDAGIPPFTKNSPEYIIKNRKTDEELCKIKVDFVEEFKKTSKIKRTFLEYTLSPFNLIKSNLAAEPAIYYKVESRVGFTGVSDNEATIVLPPIGLAVYLFSSTSKFGLEKPNFMFGYSSDVNEIYKHKMGRPITGASMLFEVPFVHLFIEGPKSLSMFMHDIMYHLPLEANNPHVSILKEIGIKLLKADMSSFPEGISKFFKYFAEKILDCEANSYKFRDPKNAFWIYLKESLKELTRNICFFSGLPRCEYLSCFNEYINKIFIPIVKYELENLNVDKDTKPEFSQKRINSLIEMGFK